MDDLFGLPAHPLLVHGAVVLVPLAALGAVVIACSGAARRRFGYLVVALAFLGLVFSFLAKESGESLAERVDDTAQVQEHAELGDAMPLFAFALFVTVGALVAIDVTGRRREAITSESVGPPPPPGWMRPATVALAVLTVVVAVATTVQVAEVGHSGAKATWANVRATGERGAGPSDGH